MTKCDHGVSLFTLKMGVVTDSSISDAQVNIGKDIQVIKLKQSSHGREFMEGKVISVIK